MSAGTVGYRETLLASGDRHAALTLAAPTRCNSLEPSILEALGAAIDRARTAGAVFLTIEAEGRHFSTGGDVAAFAAEVEAGNLTEYSDCVVGALQDIIRRLLTMPAIVVTAAQGAITGGSAGLVFASDIVLLAEDAFIQPYFTHVGFSPDGGWSALLPERVGAGRALQIQLTNERIAAIDALSLGLAQRVVPSADLQGSLRALIDALSDNHVAGSMLAAKRLVWDDARLASVEARLGAELASFKRQITAPETALGMSRFLRDLRTG